MKFFLVSLFTLIFVLIGSFFYITSNDLLLNKAAMYSQKKFAPSLKIDWNKVSIGSVVTGAFSRKISLKAQSTCISYVKSKICIDKLRVEFLLNILNPLSSQISELTISLNESYIVTAPEQDPAPLRLAISELLEASYSAFNLAKKYFPQRLALKTEKITINESLIASLDITKSHILILINNSQLSANLNLRLIDKSFEGDLIVSNNTVNYKAKVTLALENRISLQLESLIKLQSNKSPISLLCSVGLDDKRLLMNVKEFNYALDSNIAIKNPKCSLEHVYSKRSDIFFHCDAIKINVKNKIDLVSSLKGSLAETIDFSKNSEFLQVSMSTNNLDKEVLDLTLNAAVTVKNKKEQLIPSVDSFKWKLYAKNFQKVVQLLKKTKFAVIAPLNVMRGKVRLYSEKIVSYDRAQSIIPFKGQINLIDTQKNKIDLDLDTKLTYKPNSTSKLTGDISITQVNINLPPIDPLGGVPNISSSDRIKRKLEISKKKEPTLFYYDLKVTSKSNSSLKLYYHLLKPYFAFGINARVKNNKTSYQVIANKDFSINYLKRSINFDKMRLKSLPEGDSSIDAQFDYKVSGYKIILKIIGTTKNPKLILKSYPSLPREDIISLLIFKRRSNSISTNQRQSVGSTEAAIADKALSLFSIWAFASTPIDYVSYNPDQKTYSASISLPSNTSLQIGTNWETINNLTLRKQLSDTWAIETSYNPNDEDAKQNLMLQKEINF